MTNASVTVWASSSATANLPAVEAALRTSLPFPGSSTWRRGRRLPRSGGPMRVMVERVGGRWMAVVRVGRMSAPLVAYYPPCGAPLLRSMGRAADAEEEDARGRVDAERAAMSLAMVARDALENGV